MGPPGPGGDLGDEDVTQPPGGVPSPFGSNTGRAVGGRGAECTLGSIELTAGAVGNGTPAAGRILAINDNQALFALIGNGYGGNGTTTFALPDLRDAAPNGRTYTICDRGIFPSRL